MMGNRSRDTMPERLLRSELHRNGHRFRVDVRPVASIPRRADIVFGGLRLAVFVDGCFWHGCPRHYRPPKTNSDYWIGKIRGNRERDLDTATRLNVAGWTTLRIWEHETTTLAAERVAETMSGLRRRIAGSTIVGYPKSSADAQIGSSEAARIGSRTGRRRTLSSPSDH